MPTHGRRKDFKLYTVIPLIDAATYGAAGRPSVEDVLESLLPKAQRVAAQDRQITRRVRKLKMAKTRAMRWTITQRIQADIKQRRKAVEGLKAKHLNMQSGLFGNPMASKARIEKMGKSIAKMEREGAKITAMARQAIRTHGASKLFKRRSG